jgi:hypothetical protein
MDLSGLDVAKLKSLAIEKWRSGPGLWPVKVLSLARTLELEQKQGGTKLDSVGGYFTCVRAVRFQMPQTMEDILGFAPGTFVSGVSVWKLKTLPPANQFELRGYTQLPGGDPFDGIVFRRSGMARPEFFTNEGTAPKFIPGLAVEQWELLPGLLVPAVELERVPPGKMFTKWQ